MGYQYITMKPLTLQSSSSPSKPPDKSATVLLLSMGNDIMGDDGAGFVAAQMLKEKFAGKVDFIETIETGLSLLDLIAGYERVLLLDTIVMDHHDPGAILEFSPDDFSKVPGPSSHYLSLPVIIELANRLAIDFPKEINILAINIRQPAAFSRELTPTIQRATPEYVKAAAQILRNWEITPS